MDNELEIMRILRVPPNGQLVAELKGNRYEAITDLKNPKNRQLVLAAVGELITFVGGYKALEDAGVAPPLNPQTQQKSLEEQRAEFLASMQGSGGAPTAVNATDAPIETKVNELPIVEQIDEVLQKHLRNDPDLNHRSIHLIDNHKGGIHIKIDEQVYTHPKKIEDKRIQLLIKRAIKEWESK